MTKPIPVFTFVFAAYAATATKSGVPARRSATERSQVGDTFLQAWRVRSTRAGAIIAKVGLLTNSASGELRFAVRSSDEVYEELWLDGIAETHLGFIGAATDGPKLPLKIRPGQLLKFHRINVLDWRLEDGQTSSPALRG